MRTYQQMTKKQQAVAVNTASNYLLLIEMGQYSHPPVTLVELKSALTAYDAAAKVIKREIYLKQQAKKSERSV